MSNLGRGLLALGRACHPGPVAAVSAASYAYARSAGCGRALSGRIGLAVLLGQLSVGWQNDAVDARRDRAAGRRDKPVATGDAPRGLVAAAAVASALAAVAASRRLGGRAGRTHLLALASATAYNLGLKATPASPLPYAYSFSRLPEIAHRARDEEAPWWAAAAAGTLGLAAHFVNVLPDRDVDRELGVLGLPQRLSPEADLALAAVLLGASSLLVGLGPQRPGGRRPASALPSLGLAAIVALAARRRRGRLAFRLLLVLALFDVGRLLRAAQSLPLSDAPMPERTGRRRSRPARALARG